MSPSCLRITGYPPSAFMEDPGLFLRLVHPEDRDTVAAFLREATSEDTQPRQFDFRIQTPQGEVRWIGLVGLPVHTQAGAFLGFRASNRDITDHKRAEADRREIEHRLMNARRLESLGVLAGGIAHDFNNLLTAILGNLDLALLDLTASSPIRAYIDNAIQASCRAAELSRQILAYTGKGFITLTSLDLNDLVREHDSSLRMSVGKTVTLNLELTSRISRILADPAQVREVVLNLITNAAEAIGEKPGVITLVTGERECDQAYLQQSRLQEIPPAGRYAYVEVTDSGCGMDLATQERLFEPFFTTKFLGRGLGMSAVLGIVRQHRGAILLESEVGLRTTIRVLFPVATAEAS
jgi:PAS domain S-box-containing protein